jgi:hypothetical protein
MSMEQKGYILFVKTQNVLQCSQNTKTFNRAIIAIIKSNWLHCSRLIKQTEPKYRKDKNEI